jgi:hypothetical protein
MRRRENKIQIIEERPSFIIIPEMWGPARNGARCRPHPVTVECLLR